MLEGLGPQEVDLIGEEEALGAKSFADKVKTERLALQHALKATGRWSGGKESSTASAGKWDGGKRRALIQLD